MKYRKLGNTGTVVSHLALGTMYFGDETPEDDAFAILDGFLEAGGTLVDTANVYAETASEEIIGRWFASRPKDVTDRVVLASKGQMGDPTDEDGPALSRLFLRRSLDESLGRSGVETIDLYQLHAADMHTPVEETLLFLDEAVRAGKIHYVGLSNFEGWQIQLMASTAKAMGLHLPVSLQPQYSLLSRRAEWGVLPAARHNDLAILPWSPLASEYLSGKYRRGETPAPDTRAGSEKALYQWTSADSAKSDQNWETIDTVTRMLTRSVRHLRRWRSVGWRIDLASPRPSSAHARSSISRTISALPIWCSTMRRRPHSRLSAGPTQAAIPTMPSA
jgi:aryl-alcohol dehydrogenase-like predicted oxidoreductase